VLMPDSDVAGASGAGRCGTKMRRRFFPDKSSIALPHRGATQTRT
jgi:hypothetical protein